MADEGTRAEFTDSGNVTLTNITDSKTWIQLQNILWSSESLFTKHQRTDSVLEKLVDLNDFTIEFDLVLTTPDIAHWLVELCLIRSL